MSETCMEDRLATFPLSSCIVLGLDTSPLFSQTLQSLKATKARASRKQNDTSLISVEALSQRGVELLRA